ncbi:MAG TPA: hypothetical protein VF086_09620 [Propionibacteriaceae bacterium]
MVSNAAAADKRPIRAKEVTPVVITILAWTGALLSCLLTIPQAVRTLRSDRLDGHSATTY